MVAFIRESLAKEKGKVGGSAKDGRTRFLLRQQLVKSTARQRAKAQGVLDQINVVDSERD